MSTYSEFDFISMRKKRNKKNEKVYTRATPSPIRDTVLLYAHK